MRTSLGDVGQSVRKKGEDAVPLKVPLPWVLPHPLQLDRQRSRCRRAAIPGTPAIGLSRARTPPTATCDCASTPRSPTGRTPTSRSRALRFTIDGLDNVVLWRQRARVFSVQLALRDGPVQDRPSNGFDLTESLKLERAWIEFLVPIGQSPRRPNGVALGHGSALTHAGNGLAEWGDFLRGETFDRILFATRPITLGPRHQQGRHALDPADLRLPLRPALTQDHGRQTAAFPAPPVGQPDQLHSRSTPRSTSARPSLSRTSPTSTAA